MTRYQLITSYYPSELEKRVNDLLSSGWKLQGGIAIDNGGRYAQAMIMEVS